MSPKEKANELGNKMYNGSVFDYDKEGHLKEVKNAKRCALIAVDELINSTMDFYMPEQKITTRKVFQKEYWQEVKQEIELL